MISSVTKMQGKKEGRGSSGRYLLDETELAGGRQCVNDV